MQVSRRKANQMSRFFVPRSFRRWRIQIRTNFLRLLFLPLCTIFIPHFPLLPRLLFSTYHSLSTFSTFCPLLPPWSHLLCFFYISALLYKARGAWVSSALSKYIHPNNFSHKKIQKFSKNEYFRIKFIRLLLFPTCANILQIFF